MLIINESGLSRVGTEFGVQRWAAEQRGCLLKFV